MGVVLFMSSFSSSTCITWMPEDASSLDNLRSCFGSASSAIISLGFSTERETLNAAESDDKRHTSSPVSTAGNGEYESNCATDPGNFPCSFGDVICLNFTAGSDLLHFFNGGPSPDSFTTTRIQESLRRIRLGGGSVSDVWSSVTSKESPKLTDNNICIRH